MKKKVRLFEFPNKTFTNRSPSFTCEPFFCHHMKKKDWKTGIFNIYHKPTRALMTTVYTSDEALMFCMEHSDLDMSVYDIEFTEVKKKAKQEEARSSNFPSVEECERMFKGLA